MLLDRAGLGSQSLPDLGTVPSKRPPKLEKKKKKARDSSGPAGVAVSSCHHKVNNLPAGHSAARQHPGRQHRNRLAERGDREHSLPPKRTSTRLRSQVITYRHRGTRAGLSSQGHTGASAEAGGVSQVRSGWLWRPGLRRLCWGVHSRETWSCTIHRKWGPAA